MRHEDDGTLEYSERAGSCLLAIGLGNVNKIERDYVRFNPLPDAETVLRLIGNWTEDYNDNHPHSGLKWHSPREFIRARCVQSVS